MAIITAIEPQAKNSRRVNVYLDGRFAFGLERIIAAWLKVGQELTPEEQAVLQAKDRQEQARQHALRFLSYRPRSVKEVRSYLTKRGYEEALIESVLEQLQDAHLLNDVVFAQTWVENRNTFRPRSKALLRQELLRKGIAEEAVQSVLDGQEETKLALQAAQKAVRRYAALEWPQFRQRLGAYLLRRGFSYSTIGPVLVQVWKQIHQTGKDPGLDDED
ncbi:MAG: RecX family transcriptional regulator [Anaerolineales bacterium]|nr:RecX family transcriptional regulator [Anaerolineales bacterium]